MWNPFRRKSFSVDELADRLDGGAGRTSKSGQPVTKNTAMRVMAVYACCNVLSSGCATPRLYLKRLKSDGTTVHAIDDPHYRLLRSRANEFQTAFEFREMLTMHAALCGAGLAIKVRFEKREPVRELLPIEPGTWSIEHRGRYDYRIRITDQWGMVGVFHPDDLFILPNRRWDLIKDMPVVSLARDAIGLSIALEDQQSQIAANGGRPSGILSTDSTLKAEQIARIKEGWRSVTKSVNRFKTAILDRGVKYQAIAMTMADAQSLETRGHQVLDICRGFDVFPQMIMHPTENVAYNSAEAFFAAHVRHTLGRWHELWCQRLDEFLLDGEGPLFTEFDVSPLLKASLKDRADANFKMAHFKTINEFRRDEGLDPLPDGDVIAMPLNMTPQEWMERVRALEAGDGESESKT